VSSGCAPRRRRRPGSFWIHRGDRSLAIRTEFSTPSPAALVMPTRSRGAVTCYQTPLRQCSGPRSGDAGRVPAGRRPGGRRARAWRETMSRSRSGRHRTS
jgi:hypothetical protein